MSAYLARTLRQSAIPTLTYVPPPEPAFTVFFHVRSDRGLSRTINRTVRAATPAEARARVREDLIREGHTDPRFAYHEEIGE